MKTSYEVIIPGKWWCGKGIGWVDYSLLTSTNYKVASTSRYFRTAKRAFNHATNSPSGTVVLQWSFKRGSRRLKEFIKR